MAKTRRVRKILSGPNEDITYLAVGMAEQGCWSLEAIATECQLEIWQVVYRLEQFGISLCDVRTQSRSFVKRKMLKMVIPMTGELVRNKADRIRYVRTK